MYFCPSLIRGVLQQEGKCILSFCNQGGGGSRWGNVTCPSVIRGGVVAGGAM